MNGGAQQGEAAAEDGMTAHTKSLKTEQQQQPLSPHQESESDLIDLVSDDARGDGNFVPCMQGKLHRQPAYGPVIGFSQFAVAECCC